MTVAAVLLSSWCWCCCCCCRSLALSIDGPHFVHESLLDCFTCSVLKYPTGWIKVQEVLPDAGSTSCKDMLAALGSTCTPQSAGTTCPIAQWSRHNLIPPPFLAFWFICRDGSYVTLGLSVRVYKCKFVNYYVCTPYSKQSSTRISHSIRTLVWAKGRMTQPWLNECKFNAQTWPSNGSAPDNLILLFDVISCILQLASLEEEVLKNVEEAVRIKVSMQLSCWLRLWVGTFPVVCAVIEPLS